MLGPGISQLNICGWHWKENLSFDLAQGVSGTPEPWPSSPLAPGLTMGDCAPGDAVTVAEIPIASGGSRSTVRPPQAGDNSAPSTMAQPSLSKSQQQTGSCARSPVKGVC